VHIDSFQFIGSGRRCDYQRQSGYVENSYIKDMSGRKIAYLEGDYIKTEDGKSQFRIEDVLRDVAGGAANDVYRGAIMIFLGD